MNLEQEPPNQDERLILNVDLFKINIWIGIISFILSYFTDKYDYIANIYNCLVTIFIYNNLIFIYTVYLRIRDIWKNY